MGMGIGRMVRALAGRGKKIAKAGGFDKLERRSGLAGFAAHLKDKAGAGGAVAGFYGSGLAGGIRRLLDKQAAQKAAQSSPEAKATEKVSGIDPDKRKKALGQADGTKLGD